MLQFSIHTAKPCKRQASGCYSNRIVSNELNYSIAKNDQFVLIESHLRYGICFWYFCSEHQLRMILFFQKRKCLYKTWLTTVHSCLEHEMLTLASMYSLETVCLIHKKFRSGIVLDQTCNTRSSHNIVLSIPTSSLDRTH